jgi:hypothetical protein
VYAAARACGAGRDDGGGARVPGTSYELDPVKAAWDIGCLVRFLDFNDTWLAAEWGHPSDNLGAILGIADWLSRKRVSEGKPSLTVRDVLTAMIKAHEIQGVSRSKTPSTASASTMSCWCASPPPRSPRACSAARARKCSTRLERVDRRLRAAHLPPRAEYRFAQELGRRRCHQSRRAPRADLPDRRDGLSVGADRQDLGLQDVCSTGQ